MTSNASRQPENLEIVDGLVQLSMLVQNVFAETARTHDLSALHARLLGVLRDREPTMAELRALLDLDKSSTTGLVDRAAKRGLVRRVEVPEDGRSSRVQLTDAGHALAARFAANVSEQIAALTDHLTDTNRHRLALLASSVVVQSAADHGIDLSTGIVGDPPPPTKGRTP